MKMPTALIADDEPLLRESLVRLLRQAWPELQIISEVKNGRLAVEAYEELKPDICFLDIHMPGLSGIEAARFIGRRAHVVFVTAFDQYALQAFDQGAVDYLVKPVEVARLNDTVRRLKDRVQRAEPVSLPDTLLEQLAARMVGGTPSATANIRWTQWFKVSVGQNLKLVKCDEIDFFRAEDKYTLVAWHGADGKPADGLIRTSLKELLPQLDPEAFLQVHRSVLVNLAAISHVVRGQNETADIHLKHRTGVLPVSRTFLHHFRMM